MFQVGSCDSGEGIDRITASNLLTRLFLMHEIGFLAWEHTSPGSYPASYPPAPEVLPGRTAHNLFIFQTAFVLGIVSAWVQDLALGLVEPCDGTMWPPLAMCLLSLRCVK